MLRPMLAAKADLKKLKFPLLASAKLDGVRAVVIGGLLRSRSMKLIPNKYLQSLYWPEGSDGELIFGDPTSPTCCRDTVSAVMRHGGEPQVKLHIFDNITFNGAFEERLASLGYTAYNVNATNHPHILCTSLEEVLNLETIMLGRGHEGLILRDPGELYKYGRSTVNEGGMLKLKRFVDGEARVVNTEELLHNGNEPFINELGLTSHTTHKEGKVGMQMLGALVVEDIITGVEFNIGTGFTREERIHLWNEGIELNTLVKYKSFPVGGKDKPRHPVFLGFRDERDMG